ncbi:MAG TPA: hypothetical protein VFD31_02055 [Thermoleophilaceae bacterium]|nr:hypothetical protein [Thermoleophilaceae bacterium]
MAEGVDTPVKDDEPPAFDASLDRGTTHADLQQLSVGDHPVLAARKVENRLVDGMRATFGPLSGLNSTLVSHTARITPRNGPMGDKRYDSAQQALRLSRGCVPR